MLIVALGMSLALALTSMLAWDFGRRWLEEKAATRASDEQLAEVLRRQDQNELVLKKLAEDWRHKFVELEQDWKKLKEHADSQYAGATAQVVSGNMRGFNR
jgi:hypothetical protein